MGDTKVRINRFSLRVPGMSTEDGRACGHEVARCLADSLPDDLNQRNLGALSIKVPVPAGMSRDHLASMVAKAILRGLR
jgi:hypothetical protein